jgi:hypothetical protein
MRAHFGEADFVAQNRVPVLTEVQSRSLLALLSNSFLLAGLFSWAIAQGAKPLTYWCVLNIYFLSTSLEYVLGGATHDLCL